MHIFSVEVVEQGRLLLPEYLHVILGATQKILLKIDAASNRGIDEICELREAVRTAPFLHRLRCILSYALICLPRRQQMLSLRHFEEPSSHVIFILATTDPENFPQRLFLVVRKLCLNNQISQHSQRDLCTADKEGKKLADESAELLARHGKWSYRDVTRYARASVSISDKEVVHAHVTVITWNSR